MGGRKEKFGARKWQAGNGLGMASRFSVALSHSSFSSPKRAERQLLWMCMCMSEHKKVCLIATYKTALELHMVWLEVGITVDVHLFTGKPHQKKAVGKRASNRKVKPAGVNIPVITEESSQEEKGEAVVEEKPTTCLGEDDLGGSPGQSPSPSSSLKEEPSSPLEVGAPPSADTGHDARSQAHPAQEMLQVSQSAVPATSSPQTDAVLSSKIPQVRTVAFRLRRASEMVLWGVTGMVPVHTYLFLRRCNLDGSHCQPSRFGLESPGISLNLQVTPERFEQALQEYHYIMREKKSPGKASVRRGYLVDGTIFFSCAVGETNNPSLNFFT